ncbi:MAG: NUDIX domain-containing protein [Clostridia bacterium]|nr:NUDIX domain-containing protein [Clostridia bacterium]MDE7328284.1 NUDIX domain-containing protein [Clostridia bacterium]
MRLTVRGIIINRKSDKILLLKYIDKKSKSTTNLEDGFWAMPGGGVEDGESFKEALTREIYEETGFRQLEISNCVLSRVVYLDLTEKADYYYERYYLVYTDEEKLQDTNLTTLEKEVIKQYKWWSKEEIKINQKIIMPPNIAQVLEKDFINFKSVVDLTDEDLLMKTISVC